MSIIGDGSTTNWGAGPLTVSPDSVTRLYAALPKSPTANLIERRRLIRLTDPEEQQFWKTVCASGDHGFLIWANLFAWLYEPRDAINPARGLRRLPFLTWPCQDAAAIRAIRAIREEHDMVIDKSRDMGATYVLVYILVWLWLFEAGFAGLVGSRKEELVDRADDPKALFWKIEYCVEHLPRWMVPRNNRTFAHLVNYDTGATIDGESTNTDFARGDRRRVILLDEFASVDNGEEILAATGDATGCRLYNSTPKGRGNAFGRIRFSGQVEVATLHWSAHPQKKRGLYRATENGIEILDGWTGTVDQIHPNHPTERRTYRVGDGGDYPFIADGKLRSPWYDAECARRTSTKEIAQELDIDYLASGSSLYDLDILGQIRASGQLRDADLRGEIDFDVITRVAGEFYRMPPGSIRFLPLERGRLRLWSIQPGADGRPPQNRNYVAFADIANGKGASNSVLSFADADTREVVGSWTCADTSPTDFARVTVALCRWFGGQCGYVYLGWETNGPGGIYGREIFRLGYYTVLGNPDLEVRWYPKKSGAIGWTSTRTTKRLLLEDHRRALARGELIERELAAIENHERYILYESGGVGPDGLVETPEGARAEHGDITISRAGLIPCLREAPLRRIETPEPPAKSPEGRRRAKRRRLARGKAGWKRKVTAMGARR